MKKLICICLLTAVLAASTQALPNRDSFFIEFDGAGDFMYGGGSGYNNGQWDYYENDDPGWWTQWFYDDPYDPDRWKKIDILATVSTTDQDQGAEYWVDIAVNWTTPLWPSSGSPEQGGRPPLPPLTAQDEEAWIERTVIYSGTFLSDQDAVIKTSIIVPDYNPEWVSIDIQGSGVMVYGMIIHECIPEPATLTLLGLGGLALLRRRRKR